MCGKWKISSLSPRYLANHLFCPFIAKLNTSNIVPAGKTQEEVVAWTRMTNALADSDACKDSSAAGVLAKEGERNRERGIGREEDNTIASLSEINERRRLRDLLRRMHTTHPPWHTHLSSAKRPVCTLLIRLLVYSDISSVNFCFWCWSQYSTSNFIYL